MHRSLDLQSKAKKRDPKRVPMSEMDRHSLNTGGRLTERAGGRGCRASMCHRRATLVRVPLQGRERWTVGVGASEHVLVVAGCRSTVCTRPPEDAQPPMHKSLQSNHRRCVREEGVFQEEGKDLALDPKQEEQVECASPLFSLV